MLRGIRIGELDRKITIEKANLLIDDFTHERKETWVTLASVYSKRLRNSRESYEDRQPVAITSGRYMIRWRSDVKETMRINDGGEIYYIEGIENMDRKNFLILSVIKRDGQS